MAIKRKRSGPSKAGRGKYLNKKTTVDGTEFDSKKESKRYEELVLLQKAGEISGLSMQTPIHCVANGIKIFTYKADFTYFLKDGRYMVEDVKSEYTAKLPVYRLKKKCLKAICGIDIYEHK